MPRNAEVLDRVQALEDELRIIRQVLPSKVRFVLRGYPNDVLRPSFDRLVSTMPNGSYGGPYDYPSDLPGIYGSVDLCWGFDFCSPGANSKWTLANRLYEAGYFDVPILVEEGTAGGDFGLVGALENQRAQQAQLALEQPVRGLGVGRRHHLLAVGAGGV